MAYLRKFTLIRKFYPLVKTKSTCLPLLLLLLLSASLSACTATATPGAATASTLLPAPVSLDTPAASSQASPFLPTPSPTPRLVLPTAAPTSTLLPTSRPTPTRRVTPTVPACLGQGGSFEYGEIKTTLLRAPLSYRIYLPPCYNQDLTRSYPVLYLIHGQSYTDDQWDRLGADETADILIASGELPPFLIVMPRDRIWVQPSEDNFGQAVIQLLVPLVDESYRTLPDRTYRAIGGLSRGASWAFHLGFSHWELFGAIGGHSPPVFWEDVDLIEKWIDAIPIDQLPRIYLDIGRRDRQEIMVSAVWFEELLTRKNIPHEWHLFAGYHNEEYWQSHVEKYLRWYSQGWSP